MEVVQKVKTMKVEIEKLHGEIGVFRSRAAIMIANSTNNIERRAEADAMERRLAAVERRLGRLCVKSRYKYISLPEKWKIGDLEAALDSMGAISEDRPGNGSTGGGRTR